MPGGGPSSRAGAARNDPRMAFDELAEKFGLKRLEFEECNVPEYGG
jgi:hypothetical protein